MLGLMDAEDGSAIVADPVTDDFYKNVWIRTASINTDMFDQVHKLRNMFVITKNRK